MKKIYDDLFRSSVAEIEKGKIVTDNFLNKIIDNRYGITLISRLHKSNLEKIELYIDRIRKIEPDQYFYKPGDLHLTILSIISCYDGFSLKNLNVSEYSEVIRNSLKNIKRFNISFKGITASPSCIMIQGFPENSMLNELRANLRKNFNVSDLENSIDLRYELRTAHITIVRFKEPLKNKSLFLNELKNSREFDFGITEINQLDLVFNDWYMKNEKKKLLKRFELNE